MKKVEFFATIKNGRLCDFPKKRVSGEIAKLEGKRCEVRIQYKSTRSIQQNRWYFACVTILAKDVGYTVEEMHSIIKFKFLKREKPHPDTGEVLEYIKSTSTLTKEEFSEFMESLIQWSGEFFGIKLPLPEEQLKADLT